MSGFEDARANLPTVEDVCQWGAQLERLKMEEAEMRARHEAEEMALRTKVDRLDKLIAAATAFVEIEVAVGQEPAPTTRMRGPEATQTPTVRSAETRRRRPRDKTWTATILKIVANSESGMTYHELKEEVGKTHLGDTLRQTEKALYSGIGKLASKGKIVRYRGRVFLPAAYEAFKNEVAMGLIDDLPNTGGSGRKSPNEIAVERFLSSRSNGATTKEIVDSLVYDPPSDLEVTKNRNSLYNLLSRYKKKNRLIERGGRYFLPSSKNEAPGSSEPGARNSHGGENGTSPPSGGRDQNSLAALPGAIPAHLGE